MVEKPINLGECEAIVFIPIPSPPAQLMNTIAETAKLCRERNIGLNDSALRYLCRQGTLPCLKIGSKTLISWNDLMRLLFSAESGKPQDEVKEQPESDGYGQIRPIPARLRK